MSRRQTVDRAAVAVFAAFSIAGLFVFRAAMGWWVTDPYVPAGVHEALPATAWISVVPLFVLAGLLAAIFVYRLSGVPMPGSRYRD